MTKLSYALEPKWQRLAIILMGVFLIPLDFNIVNIAAPQLRANLNASSAQLQLIIAGYGCAYALFLVTAGRLGDIYGRKWIFQIGVTAFGLTSHLSLRQHSFTIVHLMQAFLWL